MTRSAVRSRSPPPPLYNFDDLGPVMGAPATRGAPAGPIGATCIQARHPRHFLRLRVPTDLVDALGRTEIIRALGTADGVRARIVAGRIAVRSWPGGSAGRAWPHRCAVRRVERPGRARLRHAQAQLRLAPAACRATAPICTCSARPWTSAAPNGSWPDRQRASDAQPTDIKAEQNGRFQAAATPPSHDQARFAGVSDEAEPRQSG